MFHFKQFSVSHSESVMKVGTDAVLLGAWLPLSENCENILEIGCGCGVISLMLAQRTNAVITGIDIDENSVKEAQINAENSTWKKNVHFIHDSIQHYAQNTTQKYDVIASNPPFFENSLKSPKTCINISKHNETLTFEELLSATNALLDDKGRFGIVLPFDVAEKFEILALKKRLFAAKKMNISPILSKKPNRMLILFEKEPVNCEESKLAIRNDNGYTDDYYKFVREYLTITN